MLFIIIRLWLSAQ